MEPTASNTGALTKLFRNIDTACNAVTVLPTSKWAREIKVLRHFGRSHKNAHQNPASTSKMPSEVTANQTHQGGDDKEPQVRIRESVKPEKMKLDFSPMEYRRWTAQVKTFFAASNLQYAPYQEQIGYLHMCLDPNLSNHVSVTAQGDTQIMAYEDELEEEETCLDIIDAEFIKRYPITTR